MRGYNIICDNPEAYIYTQRKEAPVCYSVCKDQDEDKEGEIKFMQDPRYSGEMATKLQNWEHIASERVSDDSDRYSVVLLSLAMILV